MGWIFEHLQIVIFIVVGIFYVLRVLGQQQNAGRDAGPADPLSQDEDESAEAERTRRIQEQIRRRILARQRGEAPPTPAPPPVPRRVSDTPAGRRAFPRPAEPETARLAPPPVAPAHRAPVLPQIDKSMSQHQRDLQEKLATIRAATANRKRMVQEVSGGASAPLHLTRPDQMNARARSLRRSLVGTTSIRDAILLREIIGPPVGMRLSEQGRSPLT